MSLPPTPELFTIAEIASRWIVSNRTVEDYLIADKLQPCIRLPRRVLYHFPMNLDLRDEEHERYIKTRGILCTTTRQGVFNLANYQGIDWNERGQCRFEKGEMCLSLPNEEGLFGFTEAYILKRDDVLVILSEVNRFEVEHGISAPVLKKQESLQEKIAKASQDTGRLHPKEKESLLKMIIAMAIDGYGYNPADKKSPIPGQIVEHVEALGLAIDGDTVRKWLKEAACLLPPPEKQTN